MATQTNKLTMKKVFGLSMHVAGTGLNVIDKTLGAIDTGVDGVGTVLEDTISVVTNTTATMREESDNQRLVDQSINAQIHNATATYLASEAGIAKIASVATAKVNAQLDELLEDLIV